jgi:nucleoid-associated protein YgaU
MISKSLGQLAVPSLAIVAACVGVLLLGSLHARREGTELRTAITSAIPPIPRAQAEDSSVLATAEADASAVGVALDAIPHMTDDSVPVFDVARIEPTGEAVIAGRASPGVIVELLRNGERYDQAVADQAGQFVIVPPRLPAGEYELTLRSSRPNGEMVISKQSVAVTSNEVASNAGLLRSPAKANRDLPRMATAAFLSDELTPAVRRPKNPTAVVNRGDSLWRISRITYGDGARYAVVYNANREFIRNPNRIYPGQIFVLPVKTP